MAVLEGVPAREGGHSFLVGGFRRKKAQNVKQDNFLLYILMINMDGTVRTKTDENSGRFVR
jgi:hypothetical protein